MVLIQIFILIRTLTKFIAALARAFCHYRLRALNYLFLTRRKY